MTEYVERTGEDIYNAIVLDGIELLRGSWYEVYDGKVKACILTTAGMNLGVATGGTEPGGAIKRGTIFSELNNYIIGPFGEGIGNDIISAFDEQVWDDDVAAEAHEEADRAYYEAL